MSVSEIPGLTDEEVAEIKKLFKHMYWLGIVTGVGGTVVVAAFVGLLLR